MKSKPSDKKSKASALAGGDAVSGFMAKLKHPLKADLEAVRQIILEADPAITEEIKWNAPSFRTTESFATIHLRSVDRVQLIFHLGAKVRTPMPAIKITDPAGLIKWLAQDRCIVTVGAGKEIEANRDAFAAIIREWITWL